MTSPTTAPDLHRAAPLPRTLDSGARVIPAPVLRTLAVQALLVGIVGDQLLRAMPIGLAYPLFILVAALALAVVAQRMDRDLSGEAIGWLGCALVFASFLAWRGAPTLQAMNLLASLGALVMAAIATGDARAALGAQRLRDTTWAALLLAQSVAAGLVPLGLRAGRASAARPGSSGRLWAGLRAAAIVSVIVLVFGSLLRSSDPLFASMLSLPDIDLSVAISQVVLTGFLAWVAAGWLRGAVRAGIPDSAVPDVSVRLTMLDVTAALGTLAVLFASYVATQLGWFFGGEAFLRARTGLTAAAYARHGFFELVWVILLVVPVLMATRAAVERDAALARRHTLLSGPVIVLLGALMVSAAARMRMYVHFYGLTNDRLYPLVFMGWLAVVLVWMAVTVLRGRPARFVGGALLSGAAILALLNASDPDVIVARVNLARTPTRAVRGDSTIDLGYLATLSGAAVPLTVRATLGAPPTTGLASAAASATPGMPISDAARCSAARILIKRWGPESRMAEWRRQPAAWRGWNVDDAAAVRVVAANAPALRTVRRQTCVKR